VYIDIQELAGKLNVSVSTIRSWIREERLDKKSYFKVSNTYRFNLEAVLACLHGSNAEGSVTIETPTKKTEVKQSYNKKVPHSQTFQKDNNNPKSLGSNLNNKQVEYEVIDQSDKVKYGNLLDSKNILHTTKLHNAIKFGQKKLKAGELIEAQHIFEDILKKFPNNQRALKGLQATVQYNNSDHEGHDDKQINDLDILKIDYQFMIIKLWKALLDQTEYIEDFFDKFPEESIEELSHENANLTEEIQGFNLTEKLQGFTQELVHELYNLEHKCNQVEQRKHIAALWKVAGKLETFFDVLDSMQYLKKMKNELEQTFLDDFVNEKNNFSHKLFDNLREIFGTQYDGKNLETLLYDKYPEGVDVFKVKQLRAQIFFK
jgi:hypothetical protein